MQRRGERARLLCRDQMPTAPSGPMLRSPATHVPSTACRDRSRSPRRPRSVPRHQRLPFFYFPFLTESTSSSPISFKYWTIWNHFAPFSLNTEASRRAHKAVIRRRTLRSSTLGSPRELEKKLNTSYLFARQQNQVGHEAPPTRSESHDPEPSKGARHNQTWQQYLRDRLAARRGAPVANGLPNQRTGAAFLIAGPCLDSLASP